MTFEWVVIAVLAVFMVLVYVWGFGLCWAAKRGDRLDRRLR